MIVVISDRQLIVFVFFFFNDTATTEIYTLSLHDALPICTVVAAFTVRSLYATKAGFQSLVKLQGPFAEVKEPSLTARYADTPVETVALKDADALAQQLIAWMEGR